MKKLKNTTTNKLLVIGGTVALTSAIGYYIGKKNESFRNIERSIKNETTGA